MNILAIDATGQALSVALQAGDKVHKIWRAGKAHDELLQAAIETVLKKAKLKVGELDAVAAASGPGRFTGIRIGMAYAAVAGWSLKIPALAVSRLEALARLGEGPKICAALPGWRNEVYYQLFERTRSGLRPAADPAWIDEKGWPRVKAELSGFELLERDVDASALLAPAAAQLKNKRRPAFAPLYLKPAGYEARK